MKHVNMNSLLYERMRNDYRVGTSACAKEEIHDVILRGREYIMRAKILRRSQAREQRWPI